MPRVGLLNFILGFMTLFLAASAGAFVSFDMTQAFLKDPEQLHSWQLTLLASAHGHTNLFGILHILLGLTLPYSPLPEKFKYTQTFGLFLGVIAMGPLMLAKALGEPSESFDGLGLLIGFCLSASLATLASHAASLSYKYMKRSAT